MSTDLNSAVVYCPHCRAANSIVTDDLSPKSIVACSSCLAEMGRWGDLTSSGEVASEVERHEA
jgi:hypothetical protein